MHVSLDEIIRRLDVLPPERLQELMEERRKDKTLWIPNPGGQTIAMASKADELFFGGSPGGGKSALIIGLALTQHTNSIVFRREFPQVRGLVDEAAKILGTRKGYNGQEHIWRIPGTNRVLEFGSVPHEDDAEKYQGRPHDLKCVGPGTLVLMGDGTYKAIETIRVGEQVLTLAGPRRVSRLISTEKPAVRINVYRSGMRVAEQVQSATHQLLGPSGWASADQWPCVSIRRHDRCTAEQFGLGSRRLTSQNPEARCRHFALRLASDQSTLLSRRRDTYGAACPPFAFSSPIQCCTAGISYGSSGSPFLDREQPVECRSSGRQPRVGQDPNLSGYLSSSAISAAVVAQVLGSGCVSSENLRQAGEMHSSGTDLQERGSPCLRSGMPGTVLQPSQRGAGGARLWSSPSDSRDCCSSGSRPRDEQPRLSEGAVLLCFPQSGDVGRQSPKGSPAGGLDIAPTRSRRIWSYAHPYTMEIRQTDTEQHAAYAVAESIGFSQLFDLTVDDENHYITAGGIVNKNCFDEITHFSRSQYRYLTLWLRSTVPDQRCRIVATGNPPQSASGLWVIEHWAPWLDQRHPDPAVPGELRWAVPADDDTDRELFFKSLKEAKDHVKTLANPPKDPISGEILPPRSRTFIPGKLEENPDLAQTGYAAVLGYADKSLRNLASGKFEASLPDDEWQVIPTSWITAAQERWKPTPPEDVPMTAMGVDVAQGGDDETVLAPRHDWWFAPIIAVPGAKTPNPSDTAALVIKNRRDGAAIIVDCGGGYGGGVVDWLRNNQIVAVPHKGGSGSSKRTKDRLHAFLNKRAEVIWRFREALDPEQPGGCPIALPPDAALRADLASYHYSIEPRGIQIEDKDQIKKRIGRSPDKGDAVVMAWSEGMDALRKGLVGPTATQHRERPRFANVAYANLKSRRR